MSNEFDEIIGDIRKGAEKAGKKADEIIEISKLRLDAVTLKGELRKAYEKLGRVIYKNGGTDIPEDELEMYFEEIDNISLKLDGINERIDESKNIKRCPVCKTANVKKASYCNACGEKLD